MAIRTKRVTGGNGINYTKELDGPSDWAAILNDTYFKDLSDGLIYWKDLTGTVIVIYDKNTDSASGITFNGKQDYVTVWEPNNSTLGSGIIRDDQSTVSISDSGTTGPNTNNLFTVTSDKDETGHFNNTQSSGTNGIAIKAEATGANTNSTAGSFVATEAIFNWGVRSRAGGANDQPLGTSIGFDGEARSTLHPNTGGSFFANGATPNNNVGVVAKALNGANNYGIQISDGVTEAAGKFLTCVDSLGDAQWSVAPYTTGSTVIGNTIYFDRTDGLSAYTANLNGFTLTDGNGTIANGTSADLGGTLNQNTTISGASNSLTLGSSADNLSSFYVNTNFDSLISAWDGGDVSVSAGMISAGVGSAYVLSVQDNGLNIGSLLRIENDEISLEGGASGAKNIFKILTTGATYTDNSASKSGIEYAADYSATFTPLSLINKQYFIDNDIFTTGTTVDGPTLYFNRTDGLSAYTADLSSFLDNTDSASGITFNGLVDRVTRWTPDNNTLGTGVIRDDGNTVSISSSGATAPNSNDLLNINDVDDALDNALRVTKVKNTGTGAVAIFGEATGAQQAFGGRFIATEGNVLNYGVSSSAGGSNDGPAGGITYSFKGQAVSTTHSNIGGHFEAKGVNSATNIGILARAVSGSTNYGIQISDGVTEVAGRFLKCVDGLGDAQWASVPYTTGSTYVNSGLPNSTDTIYYDRTDTLSAYTADVTTVYDSGWKQLSAVQTVGGDTFGLAAVTAWTNPYIRVVGRTVHINGNFLIPLAQNGSSTTLRTPWTTGATPSYQKLWKTDTQTFTGTGGMTVNAAGSLTTKESMMPQELRSTHPLMIVGRNAPASRNISDADLKADGSTGGTSVIVCDTIFNSIYLQTDGKLLMTIHSDLDDSVGDETNNSVYHQLITRAASEESVPTYGANLNTSLSGNYKNSFQQLVSGGTLTFGREYTITNYDSGDDFSNVGGINATNATFFATGTTPTTFTGSTLTSDNRIVKSTAVLFPTDINGEDEDKLGGYYFMLDFSYPLSASYTDAQIKAAWDSI